MSVIPRSTTVEDLVVAALVGMESVQSTADEVMSACFTLTLRAAKTCIQHNPESRDKVRTALEVILLSCADETHPN